MKDLVPDDLKLMFSHLCAAYPREGCGLIFLEADGSFVQKPMENVYDKYHQRDPVRFPRDSRTAYKLDELQVYRLIEEAEARSAQLACIVHSHCDVGAYFSDEDKVMAAPSGQPLWPGVNYLVVAVNQGRVEDARLFRWETGQFLEYRLESHLPRHP